MKIKKIGAKEILNSKKKPTIEITVNRKYKASAPSGTSVGKHEAVSFPKGVRFAVDFINNFDGFKNLKIQEFDDLQIIEEELPKDIGANTVIALEFALLKAMSKNETWKFLNPSATNIPIPIGNCIGGGKHIKGKDTKPDIQEFLLIPNTKNFFNAELANDLVYNLAERKLKTKRRDYEKALVPDLTDLEILDLLDKITKKVSVDLGFDVNIGLDVAASSFYKNEGYHYKNLSQNHKEISFSSEEQIKFINGLVKKYNLIYVEDPLHEDDFEGFKKIKAKLVCGDDLICTNLKRLKKAVDYINTVIVKPNQIGSLIKTKELVDYAHKNNIKTVISHRSGETTDNTIAHLAVAWDIPYIKTGIKGKERLAKLNELVRIEKEIK
jgi:enolase